jgi:hypothetical protein
MNQQSQKLNQLRLNAFLSIFKQFGKLESNDITSFSLIQERLFGVPLEYKYVWNDDSKQIVSVDLKFENDVLTELTEFSNSGQLSLTKIKNDDNTMYFEYGEPTYYDDIRYAYDNDRIVHCEKSRNSVHKLNFYRLSIKDDIYDNQLPSEYQEHLKMFENAIQESSADIEYFRLCAVLSALSDQIIESGSELNYSSLKDMYKSVFCRKCINTFTHSGTKKHDIHKAIAFVVTNYGEK